MEIIIYHWNNNGDNNDTGYTHVNTIMWMEEDKEITTKKSQTE